MLLRKHEPAVVIAEGPDVWGRLVGTDAILYGTGEVRPDGTFIADPRVLAKIGEAPPREVVKLDGGVIACTALGPQRFVALSEAGELVRGNLANNAIERTRMTTGKGAFVASDPGGRALIANGTQLFLWDAGVTEVTRFDKPIFQIAHGPAGKVIVTLADKDVHLVDPNGGKRERLLAASEHAPGFSRDGRLVIGTGNGMQIEVVEVAPTARWTLPITYLATTTLGVAPSARLVVQGSYPALKLWQLPQVSADFHAWLDERTNAVTSGEDVLVWPWQVRDP